MAEVTTFSSSGADAISRTLDLQEVIPDTLPQDQFEETYDIARTVEQVEKGDYKRIALQFPDELLPHSVPIFRVLKSRTKEGREFYVLADTSYGSCCVDEVAAQHVDADALVHYGHACMSQASRLPIIYVLGKKPVDAADCVDKFSQAVPNLPEKRSVVLKYDVAYAHQVDAIIATLRSKIHPSTRILHIPVPLTARPPSSGQHHTLHSLQEEDVQAPAEEASPESSVILYIGGESLTLTNLLMTHASYEVYTYDPKTGVARLESGRTNKLLMRRYAVVQKARDADVIGILVGTLGVANYLPLIAHLRAIIKRAHKKSYTISVGKINPAKLANFLEVETFVLVACPENSLLDAKEFLRPIVTPYELEVALQPEQTWTGRYVLDFEQLLKEQKEGLSEGATKHEKGLGEPEDLDQPVFSLVSGKYRHAKRYGGEMTLLSISERRFRFWLTIASLYPLLRPFFFTIQGPEDMAPNGDSDSSALILRNQEDALSKMEDGAAGTSIPVPVY
ncbi:hypothetical protein GSI_03178 [Ganoderma sinense ZZ0214-1]|uniref:2-(3-amino-3-carboxypropyl)histidine synthase subunit 2 n=1 Tax=Ganoderma sinense ZZ0214-1 TaxID=1077348 RepID=A0A2G8SKY6_9APHY|nr:hypothetical protein GSI_03178 [Ganoderma sinense ZZ0214-1]